MALSRGRAGAAQPPPRRRRAPGIRGGRALMPLLLLRHATAGHRRPGVEESEDRLRPLDARGRRQADALPELYAGLGVDRIASSPYVRCRDSVVPLARSHDMAIEERDVLADGGVGEGVGR